MMPGRRGTHRKGDCTMKVRARHNVQDRNGWHLSGTVFETDEDLGDAVDILSGDAPETEREPEEAPEPEAKAEKPRTSRRKKTSE